MKKNNIDILCTLGPSSMNTRTIKRLAKMGASLFRINLSHTNLQDIQPCIEKIQQLTNVPVCLDTEGAQIRTGEMKGGCVHYNEGEILRIYRDSSLGDNEGIYLRPNIVTDNMKIGDIICVDFDSALFVVTKAAPDDLMVRVLSSGNVGNNKAVTVDREIKLPPLSHKDCEAIKIGLEKDIKHFALSFANCGEDVAYMRNLVGQDATIISKIETRQGIRNLSGILSKTDEILIDRGDLSREVNIELIPVFQKAIIESANKSNVPVHVATNLLESMIENSYPTRAELNDIMKTLENGANGLVLAAETAIGSHPIASICMIKKIINSWVKTKNKKYSLDELINEESNYLTLIEPHGGTLINRIVQTKYEDELLDNYKRISIDTRSLIDIDQIGTGVYSPIQGFMNREEITSVLNNYCLPNGVVWTLPIVLPVSKSVTSTISIGDTIVLVSKEGIEYATMEIEDIYEYNFYKYTKLLYCTDDNSHPGIQFLKERGDCFLGGKIHVLKRFSMGPLEYLQTPNQVRHIFEKRGWFSIIGFHTRNVPHKAHEYIQLTALNEEGADGLFIHPVIGPKKQDDFMHEIILSSYLYILDKYYPKGKTFLSAFNSYSHYAGPREAIFTALCRKNYGCSHFIVGRDHTGVGTYYPQYSAQKLFDKLGDIGIEPIFFNEVYYSENLNSYTHKGKSNKQDKSISGTKAREMLSNGISPPEWFMRSEISEMIIDRMNSNKDVFV